MTMIAGWIKLSRVSQKGTPMGFVWVRGGAMNFIQRDTSRPIPYTELTFNAAVDNQNVNVSETPEVILDTTSWTDGGQVG